MIPKEYWEHIHAGDPEAAAKALVDSCLGKHCDTWGENYLDALNGNLYGQVRKS